MKDLAIRDFSYISSGAKISRRGVTEAVEGTIRGCNTF